MTFEEALQKLEEAKPFMSGSIYFEIRGIIQSLKVDYETEIENLYDEIDRQDRDLWEINDELLNRD